MEPIIYEEKPEQAFLVALDTGEYDVEISLAELAELAQTAGATVLGALVQKRESPDKATCIGSGRLEELIQLCRNTGADLVIFDENTIIDRATFEEPTLPPEGISYVLLNGEVAVKNNEIVNGRLGTYIPYAPATKRG